LIPVGGDFTTYRVEPEGTLATKVQSRQTGVVRSEVAADGTKDPEGYVGSAESLAYGSRLESPVELDDPLDDAVGEADDEADLVTLGVGVGDAAGLVVDSPPMTEATSLTRSFGFFVMSTTSTTLTKVMP
jgi:hypothetical protein